MERHIFGLQPVREALAAHGDRVLRVLVQQRDARNASSEQARAVAGLIRMAESRGVPVQTVSLVDLDRRTKHGRHQGVLALVPPLPVLTLDDLLAQVENPPTDPRAPRRSVVLALDEIEDPQNFGAIVRTAVALGARAVLWPEHHSAPLSPSMVRASAGAVEHATLVRVPQLPEALERLHRDAAFEVLGLDANGDRQVGDGALLPERVVLVVGAEGKGLRKGVKRACNGLLKLPMAGPIGSLNASVAAALALHNVLGAAHAERS